MSAGPQRYWLAAGLVVWVLGACTPAASLSVTPTVLRERFAIALRAAPAPGGQVVALTAEGAPIEIAAGMADLGAGRTVTAETAFLWFSVTKIVTATAVMQLVEQGRIGLDDPVRALLPEFLPGVPGAEKVTVRHLLSHTSGVRNPIPIRWVHLAQEPGPTLDALTGRLLGEHGKLAFEPGTEASYSNVGYLVLGQLIERVSGETYPAYVQRHIFTPLGMRGAGFALPPRPEAVATGYSRRWSLMGLLAPWFLDERFFGERSGPYIALRPFLVDGAPYGGIVAPARDMARFAAMHLRGGELDGVRVLTPESVAAMQAPQRTAACEALPFGLGWHRETLGDEPTVYHEGGGGGFHAELRLYPRSRYAIAVVANETSFRTREVTRLISRPRGVRQSVPGIDPSAPRLADACRSERSEESVLPRHNTSSSGPAAPRS